MNLHTTQVPTIAHSKNLIKYARDLKRRDFSYATDKNLQRDELLNASNFDHNSYQRI